MLLDESIVEDAALERFGELGYVVGRGPQLAPGEPAAERKTKSEVLPWPGCAALERLDLPATTRGHPVAIDEFVCD